MRCDLRYLLFGACRRCVTVLCAGGGVRWSVRRVGGRGGRGGRGGGGRRGGGAKRGGVPQRGGAKGKQSHTHFIIAKSVVRKMGVEMHSSWI